jgi:hypothetical protein
MTKAVTVVPVAPADRTGRIRWRSSGRFPFFLFRVFPFCPWLQSRGTTEQAEVETSPFRVLSLSV